jgi:hypothetical protein
MAAPGQTPDMLTFTLECMAKSGRSKAYFPYSSKKERDALIGNLRTLGMRDIVEEGSPVCVLWLPLDDTSTGLERKLAKLTATAILAYLSARAD